MVSLNQLAIVTGMLVVYFVNYFIGGYGKQLDRDVVAREVGSRTSVVDTDRISQYLRDNVSRTMSVSDEDPASVAAYEDQIDRLVAPGDRLQASDVVELLDRHHIRVDETDIHLVSLGQLPWNVARGWRWMFASESLPALALLVLLFFVPESPRWLSKQSRKDEAMVVLDRINGTVQAQREVAAIEQAIAMESSSLAQLLTPRMRKVLVIGIALAVLQQVTGINVFLYFGPEIFRGISRSEMDAALLQTLAVGAVNLVFTVIAIWTVDRVGRKPLMLIGFAGMGISLGALGLAAYLGRTDVWLLTFILTYIGCFALSVGPVTWVILSEIFPTRIRGRALAIATICLWTANLIVSQTFPMLDKSEWLVATFHHAAPFWLYGAFSILAFVFVLRLVPETKGRTLEEIEQWWM
jgi:SP family xylose:H+ symportor-like MFS transporter